MTIEFDVTPIGKPRMTQRDKWKRRPAVVGYYAFKDELRVKAQTLGFQLPDQFAIEFHVPMPVSWSMKKRARMAGLPHQSKPDVDNMLKAVCDCLREDDSGIWSVSVAKYWAETGRIVIHAG